jgi:hypothetical protein
MEPVIAGIDVSRVVHRRGLGRSLLEFGTATALAIKAR